MAYYITFFCLLISNLLFSQSTFSYTYDLPIGIIDRTQDLEWHGNNILLASKHFCDQDTVIIACTGLSKFNLAGDLLNSMSIDTLFPIGNNQLMYLDNHVYLSGHWHQPFLGRPTALLNFNSDFSFISSDDIINPINEIPNNEGIIGNNEYVYLYGDTQIEGENKIYGQIQKIEKTSRQLIWDRKYARSDWKNNCQDLQFTPDGHLAFFNSYITGVGIGESSGYQIVKIDTAGEILDTFEFEDVDGLPVNMLVDQEGNYYFSSHLEPFGSWVTSSLGRINKLKADMSEVLWSVKLPQDPFTNVRDYNVNDYIEAQNGDIVACGHVWDASDGGPVNNIHQGWDGFIIRLSPEGIIKWLRVYKNPSDILPVEQFGKYRRSFLNKILETESGGFIAAGQIHYTDLQAPELSDTTERQPIWLLSVNENGCLDNEECEEVIVLDGINASEAIFDIGTKWTYEVNRISPPLTTYTTYEVIGLTTLNDTLAYVIEEGFYGYLEYMYVSGDSIYFWNLELEHFQLNFDFSATEEYQTIWAGQCYSMETGDAFVTVDSIRQLSIAGDTLDVQYLDIAYSSTYGDLAAKIYAGIGNDYNFKLGLGEDCDVGRRTTRLRCFENNENNYNFVGYPCDTNFIVSVNEIALVEPYVIYPNPSKGEVNIKGLTGKKVNYILYDIVGRRIQQGTLQNGKLTIETSGVYQLFITNKGVTQSVKLVILD